MPVLLAIVKAISHPDYDWRGSSTTTAPTIPVIIINGPILDELGIGYSTGALGGEQPVNIALGYFINLVGDIVGGSVPPDPDKSTLGSRGDLVALVLGENEKAESLEAVLRRGARVQAHGQRGHRFFGLHGHQQHRSYQRERDSSS